MKLGKFKAGKHLSEERKKKCVQQIEKGMTHCENCSTDSTENKTDMCIKHMKMYGRIYP